MIIKIHRNNSGAVKLTILNAEGQAWNVPNTHTLKWTVKKSTAYPDEDIIIQKELTGDGGNVYFVNLKGNDTNISVGLYKWDLKDTTQNLTLLTGDFVIQEVSYVGATIDGIIEELQEITGNVEVGVFEGESGTEDYNELYNKPKINNVTLTGNKTSEDLELADSETVSLIQQKVELKADKSELPTKTSDLINDSGYITSSSLPTKTSDLTNDSGFITSADIPTIPTKTSDLTNDSGFIDSTYHDSTKQNTLTAGTGINITGNVISATGSGGTSDYTQLTNKPSINSIALTGNKSLSDLGIQHQLTAGTNITISNNVISASGSGGGGSDIATDTLNNKLESYILRGEVVDINALNTLLQNKIQGVS